MFSALCVLAPSLALASPVQAQPVAVTVYPDRAWVEREVLVELAAGAQTVVIDNLPANVDPDTIQAMASGPAAVTDVQYKTRAIATPPANRDALAAAVQAAEDALLRVRNEKVVLETERAFLEGMQQKAVDAAAKATGTDGLDTTAIARQMQFIAAELGRLLDAGIEVSRRELAADQALRAAKDALQAAGSTNTVRRIATVQLQVARATASTITLSSIVHRASWSPVYDARIDSASGDVRLEYRAAVVQKTGEDWSDVTMTLSTAQPSSALEPPSLGNWTLAELVPPPSAGRRLSRGGGASNDSRYFAMEADSAVLGSHAKATAGLELGESLMIQAQVGGGPVNVTYTLPGRVDVPSDGNADRRLQIGTTQLDGTLVHKAVPAETEQVFLLAEATNPGPYLLLPGPTSLFVDGGFVGRTQMGTTATGERVNLPFGPLPSLNATRSVKTNRSETGFFGNRSQYEQQVSIVLENASDAPVMVRVFDRRPVSQNEKIKVEVKDLSDPLSTDPAYVRDRLPKGILRWDIEVPAGAVGDKARVLTWTLDVRWPKDMAITGL